MRYRWAGALAAISGIVLLTAGCGGASSSTGSAASGTGSAAAAPGSKNIRLIEGGGLDFSDATIYKAMSTLKAEGYNVTLDNVADSTTAMRAVLAGKDDVYLGDPVEAATAVANSHAAVKYLATVAQASDYELLALPKISLSSLSGATMATAGPGTAGQIIGIAALAKKGISTGQIHQVTVGGTSARITAILAGQVDIAPVLATDAASAVATGKVKILLNAGEALGVYLQQGLIASDSFAADSATAQATVNAFIDASRWAYTNESGYVQLATQNKLTPGLTTSEAQASWTALKAASFWASNGAMCTQSINVTLGYSYQTPGALTKANTPALTSWVNPAYTNAYLKAHGQPAGAC